MKPLDIKWGVILGLVYIVWLYLSYFLGLHTDGITKVQIVVLVSLFFSAIVLFLGLLAARKEDSGLSYSEGLKSGAIISLIGGLIAACGQFGYFTWIHPEFTEYMVEISRQHFEGQGIEGKDLAEALEGARASFGRNSYMVQSGVGLFVTGILISAVLMMFLRSRQR